jgi:hypothetical protein
LTESNALFCCNAFFKESGFSNFLELEGEEDSLIACFAFSSFISVVKLSNEFDGT